MFAEDSDRSDLWAEFPSIDLSDKQIKSVATDQNHEPIVKLLPSEWGSNKGWVLFSVDASPPAVWQVINNLKHFSRQDPSFPETHGRHSFMPYIHYADACEKESKIIAFQYGDLPIITPRKYTLNFYKNQAAFPWELRWEVNQSEDCLQPIPAEMRRKIEDAIRIPLNRGAWRVMPLPKEYRRTGKNLDRSIVIYYLHLRLAGNMDYFPSFVGNFGQRTALPKLVVHVRHQARNWAANLKNLKFDNTPKQFRSFLTHYQSSMRQVSR